MYARENASVAEQTQASSAQGIELFEDLLWDLASLSFVSHVFQPSLTFFPGNSGDDPNGSDDGVGEGTRKVMETSEATVCAQLVSVGGSHALKANFGCQKSEMCLRICWHDETVTAVGEGT